MGEGDEKYQGSFIGSGEKMDYIHLGNIDFWRYDLAVKYYPDYGHVSLYRFIGGTCG